MDFGKDLKLIVFDFDGTLHDLKLDWSEARRILGIAGKDESMGSAIDRLKREHHKEPLEALTELEEQALLRDTLAEDIKETLLDLKKKYKIAIFSRNSSRVIKEFLKRNGVQLDAIIGREEVNALKPNPEGLVWVMGEFKMTPGNTLLVGDTWHDLLVARAAGIECVIVGNRFVHDGEEQPEYRIAKITQLSGLLRA